MIADMTDVSNMTVRGSIVIIGFVVQLEMRRYHAIKSRLWGTDLLKPFTLKAKRGCECEAQVIAMENDATNGNSV
jgi:hypothetical protein